MMKHGVEKIEISNSGVTIEGHRIGAMSIGENIQVENFGRDKDGDHLYAVTITVFAQNVAIGERLNGGTRITECRTH